MTYEIGGPVGVLVALIAVWLVTRNPKIETRPSVLRCGGSCQHAPLTDEKEEEAVRRKDVRLEVSPPLTEDKAEHRLGVKVQGEEVSYVVPICSSEAQPVLKVVPC